MGQCLLQPYGDYCPVARTVTQGSGYSVREVDLSASAVPAVVGADEILLAAVSVFGSRVLAVALERLSVLKGSDQPAVAVYGNRVFEDALLELKDVLETKYYTFDFGKEIKRKKVGETSVLDCFSFFKSYKRVKKHIFP